VTKKENGSYIADIDGVRKVIDKPLGVSKNTYSSSKTKSNGRTKSNHTTHYSFITNGNKNLQPGFSYSSNKPLPPKFQKDMDKMNEDMKKMTKKMNEGFAKDRNNMQKDMDKLNEDMKKDFWLK